MSEQTTNTRKIIELLFNRHLPPQWASFAELRGSTGYINEQRLDFFAMHLWPSQGFRSVAYEIKVSRGDFQREIENPKKRAFAESVSHECYFAVPQGLVEKDEVPEGWGLLEANAGGLKRVKLPTQRAAVAWPPSFVAAIARRSTGERPELPLAVWKYAGKDIGIEELLKIAEEKRKETVEHELGYRERRAVEKYKESPAHKELQAIHAIARRHLGWGVKPEEFEKFMASGMTGGSPSLYRDLQQAAAVLNRILEKQGE